MRVDVLGPIRVDVDGVDVVLSASKERALAAALALNAGAIVSPNALIDALWGDAPPASARKTLQTYVSNLRRALGATTVQTDPNGYVLDVDRDSVDVWRFRRLVRDAEDALRSGATSRAREQFAAAIALWRGDPFGGVATQSGLSADAVRLREEYASALEGHCAAELAAGRHAELVGELEALVREFPFRERLWGHLIVALYRSGRQADALAACERVRVQLRDELGLEPGGELRRIQRSVLEQDDSGAIGVVPNDTAQPVPFRSAVRYAKAGQVHVAYQVIGDGPVDLIAVPGFVSHLDMWWDAPTDTLVRRMASFSRLILFDKRGMGLSDRPEHIESDDWIDDMHAVLDATGSERAIVLGISAGAPTAALFAARYPSRVQALVLYGGCPRIVRSADFDMGYDQEVVDAFIDTIEAEWGTGGGLEILAPSLVHDPAARQYWARLQTTAASPHAGGTFLRALASVDIRDALPDIVAPTLIVHAERDVNTPIEGARLCRALIPDARLVELDTDIHLIWLSDKVEQITDEIESFVGTILRAQPPETVLATILMAAPKSLFSERPPEFLELVQRHGGRLVPGTYSARFDRPALAISCGVALTTEPSLKKRGISAAIHSGECQLTANGVVGYAADVVGALVVHADKGEVMVSQTVRDLVAGSDTEFVVRGDVAVGVDGTRWAAYAVAAIDD